MTRMISAGAGVEFNTGVPAEEETLKKAFASAGVKITNGPIAVAKYENRVSIDELISVLTVMSQRGVRFALLDNLNFFLDIVSSDMERAELDRAIHELVIFVKNNPMHIVLIVHPRKTDNGRVESEFDLKGSATAVQEAANVLLFNRPTEAMVNSRERNWYQRECVFKKIRKRGMFVNKPFWLEYRNGGYEECESVRR